jgi:hypothetical protein
MKLYRMMHSFGGGCEVRDAKVVLVDGESVWCATLTKEGVAIDHMSIPLGQQTILLAGWRECDDSYDKMLLSLFATREAAIPRLGVPA